MACDGNRSYRELQLRPAVWRRRPTADVRRWCRWTALIAFLVSAGGFAAVLVYQYVNVGAIGPLPKMYDPPSTRRRP